MIRISTFLILSISCFKLLCTCNTHKKNNIDFNPKRINQWINPVFYNNDFEDELNFPLWFDDSLIKAHEIYKITKRVYARINEDSSEVNSINQAVPKEKIEYYFDPNGLVDEVVIYSYFDDREISRTSFKFDGNMLPSGYRNVIVLATINLSKKNDEDEFSTELYKDDISQFNQFKFLKKTKKYSSYMNLESNSQLFIVKNRKFWGPLSIDSILNPKNEDWIVLGTMRKPYKRYQVENTVNESNVTNYFYYKSGVLKRRTQKSYPFENKRSFVYNKKNQWIGYIDSTFSNGSFVTKIRSNIFYDNYFRPNEILHFTKNNENKSYFYKETLSYRTKIK